MTGCSGQALSRERAMEASPLPGRGRARRVFGPHSSARGLARGRLRWFCACRSCCRRYENKVLFNFLSAFAVGGLICLACRLVPALHSDKVIIGDIMLLIPGLAFTNAVKDIFIGDTISGVMRLIETIFLRAAALALGFALAGWLLGA